MTEDQFEAEASRLIPILEIFKTDAETRDNLPDTFNDEVKKGLALLQDDCEKIKKKSGGDLLFVLLHTHLSYAVAGTYRHWLGWLDVKEALSAFNIKLVVNLIDNAFVSHGKLAADGRGMPIRDVLTWRDLELMLSEFLVSRLFTGADWRTKLKVLSVNHTIENFCKLIHGTTKQIYLAYTIAEIVRWKKDKDSNVRARARDALAQNVEFRSFAQTKATIFDPATIDEMPLLSRFRQKSGPPNYGFKQPLVLQDSVLWPQLDTPQQRLSTNAATTWTIPQAELLPLLGPKTNIIKESLIGYQIRSRDFALVAQSDGMLVYRPTLPGRLSGSVQQELRYAKLNLGRPYFIISDNTDQDINASFVATMDYKIQSTSIGKYDLSTPALRQIAFEDAWQKLSAKINAGTGGPE